MPAPDDRHISPWLDTLALPALGSTVFRPAEADVVVVGAGITGVTTALLLQRAGRRVALVEARRFGESVTTSATVKVTVGHTTVYSAIAEARGRDAAAAYAAANVAGFEQIRALATERGVDCQFEGDLAHVVYAEDDQGIEAIDREAAVVAELGLPAVRTDQAPVPFPVAAALRFDGQAQFHPGRYLAGLAEAFVAAGGSLMEGVRVRDVDESSDGCRVETTAGELAAEAVVVATQHPILDRGGHFAHLKATRSYGIAGVLPPGVQAGMTINVGSPTRSTRTARLDEENLLIVVGEGHEVGRATDTEQRWERLRAWAGEHFGVRSFRYHWSAQEIRSLDHVPFAGFISPVSKRVLTATAYAGWGMTNGTASAMLLRDLILGHDNPWAATFDARRAETSLPGLEFVKHNVRVGKTWLSDRLVGAPVGSPAELQPGEAAILDVDGRQTAAYRDDDGVLHAVSAVCTHMACNVEWNSGERSWDCPCHGSRFDPDGAVLHGPATTPLERWNPA